MSVRHIDFHLCNNNNRARVHRRTCITLHVPTSIFTRKLEEWRQCAGVTVTHGVAHETPHSSSWQTTRDQRHAAERPRGPGMETLVECLTYAAVRWITNRSFCSHIMLVFEIRWVASDVFWLFTLRSRSWFMVVNSLVKVIHWYGGGC